MHAEARRDALQSADVLRNRSIAGINRMRAAAKAREVRSQRVERLADVGVTRGGLKNAPRASGDVLSGRYVLGLAPLCNRIAQSDGETR